MKKIDDDDVDDDGEKLYCHVEFEGCKVRAGESHYERLSCAQLRGFSTHPTAGDNDDDGGDYGDGHLSLSIQGNKHIPTFSTC